MSFLNPAGLWGLLGIPVLILIYLIKPKFQERLVTSTFIWKLSKKYQKKKLPWQITNLLLFVMQLITIVALSFILARPVIVTEDGAAEKIVILDASGSMLVEGKNGSRFDAAKEQICDLADDMESYGKMTVILAASESRVLMERSDSAANIKEALERTECTYGEAALQEAFVLAKEVITENPEAAVYLFTDREYEENESIIVVNVAETAWNVAISSLSAERAGNRNLIFSAELTSYGADTAATVVLYVDGVLADAQMVGLVADMPAVVEFADFGIREYESAKVYVEAADAVAYDNEYHLFDKKSTEYEVLLVSEEPTFLEAALMTYDTITVTTVASLEELDLGAQQMPDGSIMENIPSTGYDLYIYDGMVPKELPGDGSVWMFHPDRIPKGVTFKMGEEIVSESYLEVAPDSGTELFAAISNEVSVSEVYINEYVELYSALGFETIFTCDGAPVILVGETENARAALFAFDLGATNLPLRIAFPALIHNLVSYSLSPVLDAASYEVGNTITLNKVSGTSLTSVMADNPAAVPQHHVKLPVSFVAEKPGVYTVSRVLMDETTEESNYFVSFPKAESNLTAHGGVLPELDAAEAEVHYEKEITRWLVIALLLLLVVEYILQHREQFLNKKLSYVIHAVILLLLVALLAEWKITREKNEIETIVLVDLSDSTIDSREVLTAYVKELSASAGDKNRVGVVTYGGNTVSASELSEKGDEVLSAFLESETLPEPSATNLEEALYYAESLLDDKQNQRIIVLSDGLETDGDALQAAKVLAERGVQIDAVCIPTRTVGFEVQINSLSHPETLHMGETTAIRAVIQSNNENSVEIRFYDNQRVIHKRIVNLTEGLNEYTMEEYTPTSIGTHEISCRVIPVYSDIKENNVYYSWLEVSGKGNLLLIDGTGREAKELKNLLSEEYSITVIEPEAAEGYANQLAAYQGVILMNVSNADLPEGFDEVLETYIKKYGGGVLTTGGSNTYAYGSMTETAFEEFLPITLEQSEEQTTAMILVVDTSSSMNGLNHEMAIQGSVQCIETLAETDYVGVLTFDRSVNVIYELSSMEEKDAILEAVEAIELGRGTYMTDATQEAFNQLKDFEADNKHVIILSDGEPQDSGYIRVVKQMASNGITVSAIAVGQGANRRIMQVIAETGNGNYYNASTVRDLPEIMVEETMSATDSYRQTGHFPISVASYSTLLQGVEEAELPAMSGYTTTFLKKSAEQYLTVNGGEPLYVQWSYGSGNVGSFTADLRGGDSEELFASEAGQQLIRNMLQGVIRSDGAVTALQADVAAYNTTAVVEIIASVGNRETLTAAVLAPDGTEQPVDISLTSDGTYTGTFPTDQEGLYTITITHLDAKGTLVDFVQKSLASSYSAEYDCFAEADGEERLLQVCATTGGNMAYTVANVVEFQGELLKQVADPTVLFLFMTLVLFLTDIAVRKFRLKKGR